MIEWLVAILIAFVIFPLITGMIKIDFKFKTLTKEERKEKGWLIINGRKIF